MNNTKTGPFPFVPPPPVHYALPRYSAGDYIVSHYVQT